MSGKGQPMSHRSRGPLSASFSTSPCDILRRHLSSSTSRRCTQGNNAAAPRRTRAHTLTHAHTQTHTHTHTYFVVAMCEHVRTCSHICTHISEMHTHKTSGSLGAHTLSYTGVEALREGRRADGGWGWFAAMTSSY